MKKTLVVCYSRSGTTLRVAREIATALGADLERIEEASQRAGKSGFVVSAFETLAKGLPSIGVRHDPRAYELVVIGTPVWLGSMCSPVRSYVFMHRGRLPRLAFFATMRGRGADSALAELKLVCQAEDAPTCAISMRDVEKGRHWRRVDRFTQQLAHIEQPFTRNAAE